MKCINFDRAFERYMAEWIKENSEKYKDDMDVIEDMMPDVYLEFLKKPADFLDGVAPQDYFEQFDNADMLVNWLCDYIAQGVPVPDLLLERVTALGNPAEKSLLENYGVTPYHYEDLGDGVYQVYVEIDGEIVPFVTVDSATGDYHG